MRIDLTSLVGDNVHVLAGMERGIAARKAFEMDLLDAGDEGVVIVAPDNLEAIAPSFVQGFFSKTLSVLGEKGLLEKYRFELDSFLTEDMTNGIKRLKMSRKIAGHRIA